MNILILGKGFLGQKIYQHLQDNNERLVQDPEVHPRKVHIFSKSDLDYTDYWALKDHLQMSWHDYNFVINASGYTGVPNIDAAEDDKETCWKMNVEVPATILAACQGSATMIHLSSGCIFNGFEKEWTEEDAPNWGVFNPESSFYSKSKHAAETLLKNEAICLRIRMPFTGDLGPRNYFTKLLGYDNLISERNSVTCVEDLCESILNIIERFVHGGFLGAGIYHLVNEGTLTAKQVVECLNKYGLTNPNHRFIETSELHTKAARSNCILSTEITRQNLGDAGKLPNALESLEKCVKEYAAQYSKTRIDYSI